MKHGFSLVELSIVLVILGLLVGGVMTGQNLIRAAELRSINSEFQSFQTAVHLFKDKYFALPGDMQNASAFWGASTACSGADADGVCDGDGNGIVGNPQGPDNPAEAFQFWRHLAKAGLIQGEFTGIAGPTEVNGYSFIKGVNTPQTKMSDTAWLTIHRSLVTFNNPSVNFTMDYGHHFHIGRYVANANISTIPGFLTPAEAWGIDQKLDDGRPAYGNVIATQWNDRCSSSTDGSSASTDLEADYRLSDDSKQCTLIFRHAY